MIQLRIYPLDDGGWVVADDAGWVPGVYISASAAALAALKANNYD